MPCPLFEPRAKVELPRVPAPRLPLLHEFAGVCHAGESNIDPQHRFQYCNQGNAKGRCPSFPATVALSCVRFAVIRLTEQTLTVLVVEEENYCPKAWSTIDFLIHDQRLEPEISNVCRRAQVFHFCLGYLENTK